MFGKSGWIKTLAKKVWQTGDGDGIAYDVYV